MTRFAFSVDHPALAIGKCCTLFLLLSFSFIAYGQQPEKTGPFIPKDIPNKDSVKVETPDSVFAKVPLKDSATRELISKDSTRRDSVLTVAKSKKHSPLKAALFSLAVPGLGQAYNKRYWKIPIVYAGFGGLSYAIYHTATNFHGYRRAYRAQVAIPPDYTASYKGVSDAQTLKSYRDYYKKYLDISIICFALWDVLQIVDATVDAHLFEWNMRDDLSVSWQPSLIAPPTNFSSAATGVKVQFRF